MVLTPFGVSLFVAFFAILILIPRLRQAGIVGKDMHKPGKPEVPEMGGLAIIAASLHETTALILLLSGLGALLGVIYFNWYPARVLVGDVGTLSIGAIIATAVIVGNFETAGVIVIIPYAIDLIFKVTHGFPKSFGEPRPDGKLHCPANGPVGLGQVIMKLSGGISERSLVLTLIGIEAIFGLVAVLMYARL